MAKERAVNNARRLMSKSKQGRAVTVPDDTFFYTNEDVDEYLDELALSYPNIVQIEVLGQTYEGRNLRAVKISLSGSVDGSRPTILVDSLIHAR